MKKLLTLLASMIAVATYAQTTTASIFPMEGGKVVYTGVVKVDSTMNKAELYTKAKKWFIKTYKSANDVIQLDDKDNGEIIGKGFFEEYFQPGFGAGINTQIYHTISISIKDGKYRYKISEFISKSTASGITAENPLEVGIEFDKKNKYVEYYTKIDKKVKGIIASIETAMKEKSGDDW